MCWSSASKFPSRKVLGHKVSEYLRHCQTFFNFFIYFSAILFFTTNYPSHRGHILFHTEIFLLHLINHPKGVCLFSQARCASDSTDSPQISFCILNTNLTNRTNVSLFVRLVRLTTSSWRLMIINVLFWTRTFSSYNNASRRTISCLYSSALRNSRCLAASFISLRLRSMARRISSGVMAL